MAEIVKDNSNMEFPLQIKRQYAGPIDTTAIWYDLEAAKEYAKSGATSYPGQSIAVVDESGESVTLYKVLINGDLEEVGAKLDILGTEEAQGILDKYTKGEE